MYDIRQYLIESAISFLQKAVLCSDVSCAKPHEKKHETNSMAQWHSACMPYMGALGTALKA